MKKNRQTMQLFAGGIEIFATWALFLGKNWGFVYGRIEPALEHDIRLPLTLIGSESVRNAFSILTLFVLPWAIYGSISRQTGPRE